MWECAVCSARGAVLAGLLWWITDTVSSRTSEPRPQQALNTWEQYINHQRHQNGGRDQRSERQRQALKTRARKPKDQRESGKNRQPHHHGKLPARRPRRRSAHAFNARQIDDTKHVGTLRDPRSLDPQRPIAAVRAARNVVIGTAATKPIDPTMVRTISTATTSELAASEKPKLESVRSSSKGIEAPA